MATKYLVVAKGCKYIYLLYEPMESYLWLERQRMVEKASEKKAIHRITG